MQEGKFGTLGYFIWLGFLGDCTIALGLSAVIAYSFARIKNMRDSKRT